MKVLSRLKAVFPAIFLVAVVYYIDTWIFGLPVIGITAWKGGWTAFAILAPLYFLIDYALGRMTLKLVIEEKEAQEYGLVMKFVRKWFNSLRDTIPSIEKRLSARNRMVLRAGGFTVASYFGTAFLTIPAMYMLGQRKYLRILTAVSAAIYSITFVAQFVFGTSIVMWAINRL